VDADLVGRVLRILDDTGTDRHRLRLGMPVRMLLAERAEPMDNLRVLAEVGVGTMLDEFGGNPEELACLEDLPVDMVRIDDRLVASQARRTNTGSAVGQALTSLISVVHKAGGTVTVAGLDRQEQADWWRRAGADTALGAVFAS
jgi:EAL domain-containing protein (putative c-di-GMP-specific phosphodiesterase class I)